jgi:hypothetical protein
MLDRSDRDRRLSPALCLIALLGLAPLGCAPAATTSGGAVTAAEPAQAATAQQQTQAQPAAATAQAAETGDAAETGEEPKRTYPKGFDFPTEPADGKWLVDDQGRRYFEHEVAKIEGTYVRLFNNTRVKFWYTAPFELLRETDSSFFVKIYGAVDPVPPVVQTAVASAVELTPEQILASYKPVAAEADRLRFTPWAKGLPVRGQWRQGFDIADVNADGQLDIVHGPPRKGGSAPAIFLGDGKGGWRRWSELRLPELPLDYGDAAAADFNGDGVTDLAFASHLRGIVVLVGDGKGGFTPWSEGIDFVVPGTDQDASIFTSRALDVADWNGDGRPDLLALGEGPTFSPPRSGGDNTYRRGSRGTVIFLNQGDGTWRKQTQAGVSFGDAMAVGDFNGDRRLDFLAASGTQGNQSLLSLGQQDGSWKDAAVAFLRPNATFRGVAAADFDGDGREDLAVGYSASELKAWRTGVDVLLARPGGQWERRALGVEDGPAGIWALDAGDLDGDGRADLVAITGEGEVWTFLGDGKGGFANEASPELALKDLAGCRGYHVEVADLDGDRAAEIVAGFAGEGGGFMGDVEGGKCLTGGSLRVWKGARQGGR